MEKLWKHKRGKSTPAKHTVLVRADMVLLMRHGPEKDAWKTQTVVDRLSKTIEKEIEQNTPINILAAEVLSLKSHLILQQEETDRM